MIKGKVKRVKIIKYIVSLKRNHAIESSEELSEARHTAIKILKDAGVFWGIIISHPWRGGGKDDRGGKKRAALDRDVCSLHFHGVGLAYYADGLVCPECGFVQIPLKGVGKLCTYCSHIDTSVSEYKIIGIPGGQEENNKLWAVTHDALEYQIDHAGWIGNGQAIVRFGRQLHIEDQDKPPDPVLYYLHPTTGERFSGIDEDGISEMAMNRIYQSIDKYKRDPEIIGLGWEEDGIRFIPDVYAPKEYDMTLVDIWENHLARMCGG